jgi:hypothetical protein
MILSISLRVVPPICSQKHGKIPTLIPRSILTSLLREEYIAPVPEAERNDLVKAYHKLLNSEDEKVRIAAARAWSKWE